MTKVKSEEFIHLTTRGEGRATPHGGVVVGDDKVYLSQSRWGRWDVYPKGFASFVWRIGILTPIHWYI